MSSTKRSFRFARSVVWSFVGQIGIFAANFVAIPFLLSRMGTELYGLYILLYAAAGYLSLMTLGSGGATLKYVAEFAGIGDRKRLGEALRYGALFHLAGSCAGAAVLFCGASFCAARLFGIPPHLNDLGVFMLRCAAVGAVFAALVQFCFSAMQGFQRFDLQSKLSVFLSVLTPLVVLLLFQAGHGLRAAALSYVGVNFAFVVIGAWGVWMLFDGVKGGGNGKEFSFRKFSFYGLGLALGPVAWIVAFQFDKIFIASRLPLSELTLYSVPANLLQRLQFVPAVIATVLVPMMSELGGEAEALPRMYLKSVRVILSLALPPFVGLFVLMPQFLSLWLGGEFGDRSVWPARLLVLAQAFFMLVHVPNAVSASRDKPLYLTTVAWSQAVLSMLGWYWLIPRYGILGAATGSLAAQAFSACGYLTFVHGRLLNINLDQYAKEALSLPVVGSTVLAITLLALRQFVSGWLGLIGLAALGGCVYAGVLFLLAPREDRDLFLKYLRWEAGV